MRCRELVTALLMLLSGSAMGQVIVNADFADWAQGEPDGWSSREDQQKVVPATGLDHPSLQTGMQVRIVADGGSGQGEIYQNLHGLEPATRYQISADVRATSDGVAFIQVKPRRDRREIERVSSDRASEQWQTLTVEFDTADSDYVEVLCRYNQREEQVGTKVWFTNFRLERVGPGEPSADEPVVPALASGRDQYILPDGAGNSDGRAWEHARPASAIQEAIAAAGPGQTVHIGSGDYGEIEIVLQHGGTADDRRLTIRGVDTGDGYPRFASDFTREDPANAGGHFLRMEKGVSFVTAEHVRLEGYNVGVTMNGSNEGVRLTDIDLTRGREGIKVLGGATAEAPDAGTRDLVIRDCDFTYYTKRGIRIRNGVSNVDIINCHADAGGKEWYVESFPMGFTVEGSREPGVADHHITYRDCTSSNNWQIREGRYWNGDGFTAERAAHHITYINCAAFGNTDGGWDLKSEHTVLRHCIAFDNKRNFRIWGGGQSADRPPVRLINCIAGYSNLRGGVGNPMGVHVVHGARVSLERVTIIDNQTGIELSGRDDNPARIVVRDSILYTPGGRAVAIDGEGSHADIADSVLIDADHGGRDPQFVSPSPDWTGGDHSFDSRTWPDFGYRHPGSEE